MQPPKAEGFMPHDTSILRPGSNCWRIERSDRVAVIVDAADHFATVRDAILRARHSVMLIGWDFDTRIKLDPVTPPKDMPNRLGRFLDWVVRRNPELRIHVLKWDLGTIKALGRGSTPLFILDWMTDRRIRFRLDGRHPPTSAHHQKIVVVDDTMAFCGGIDMTADRWDTREHLDDDPRRVRPTSRRRYGPWHDVSVAVDGDAARALGDLARERWHRATGERLESPPPLDPVWPEGLTPSLRNVDVAISRTVPRHSAEPGCREIEALYLDAIAAARRTIYIETQYFASRRVAEAMAKRLREPNGPEIVVLNPETADGWLEEEVMGSSRVRVLDMVREADIHDRFRIYSPVTEGRRPIYVHAKVMVVDDWLLRVGSSNLNNRSLGFDTECDLSIEASDGHGDESLGADTISGNDYRRAGADATAADLRAGSNNADFRADRHSPAARNGARPAGDPAAARLRQSILGLRHDLLAEHLGATNAMVEEAVARNDGSLIRAIEALISDGRSLVRFEPPELNPVEEKLLAENALLDPERPGSAGRRLRRHLRALLPRSLRRA